MSDILSQKLANLDTELEKKRKDIINKHTDFLISQITSINSQIDGIKQQIKLLDEIKNNYTKELQSICDHRLKEYDCWDGHKTNYEYICIKCSIHLYKS
jgi:phage terminase large subunit-like protein